MLLSCHRSLSRHHSSYLLRGMENFIVHLVVASSWMHSLLAVGHCSLTCKQDWVAWHCSLVWITVYLWKKHSNLNWTDEHVLLNIVRGFAIGFLGGHCDAPWCIILHRCLDRRSYTEQHGSCYFRGYEWCSSCRSREEARCPSRWANYISLSLTLPYWVGGYRQGQHYIQVFDCKLCYTQTSSCHQFLFFNFEAIIMFTLDIFKI